MRALFLAPALVLGCGLAAPVLPALEAQETTQKQELLTIGSAAPAIEIEHWLSNGEGKFAPFSTFTEGQVYVVEFWATWCGPCVASMPHLSELQQSYADRGVTVVSVSDEDLETVTAFLEREVEGQITDEGEPVTFAELTKHYNLTTDPDGSVSESYMRAAGQNGIPCAFIVGKDGAVEWIGHPMRMDEPLEQVVTDTWDRAAFAAEFKAEQEFEIAMNQVMGLLREDKMEEARARVTELVEEAPSAQLRARAQGLLGRLDMMAFQGLLVQDQAAAAKQFPKLVDAAGDDARTLLQLSRMIAGYAYAGNEVSPALVNAALSVAEGLFEDGDLGGIALDTAARLCHGKGDLDRAIAFQERAVEAAPSRTRQFLQTYLDELNAEAAEAEETGTEAEADDS